MPDLKGLFGKSVDAFAATSLVILVLFIVSLILLLATRFVANELISYASAVFNYFSLFAGVGALFASAYQRMQRSRQSAELKATFITEISSRTARIEGTLHQFLPKFSGFSKEVRATLLARFFTEFQNKGGIDPSLEYDLIEYAFDRIANEMALDRGQKLFLMHVYLARHRVDILQRFLDALNRSNFTKEGAPENIYFRLIALHQSYPTDNLDQLIGQVNTVPKEAVENVVTHTRGQQIIIEKIVESSKDKERLANLKRSESSNESCLTGIFPRKV